MTLFKSMILDKTTKKNRDEKGAFWALGTQIFTGCGNGAEPADETEKQWPETGRKSKCGVMETTEASLRGEHDYLVNRMIFGFINIGELDIKGFDGLEEVKNYERREIGASEYTELFQGVLS